MARVTNGFTSQQQKKVKKVASPDQIATECPQNFNLFSECFAAISFNSLPGTPNSTQPVNFTIFADGGLAHIDVVHHSSDFETRILPLQWAIDEVRAA
jgi:ATP-binding cassette, subfamily A (ABC1), member 3